MITVHHIQQINNWPSCKIILVENFIITLNEGTMLLLITCCCQIVLNNHCPRYGYHFVVVTAVWHLGKMGVKWQTRCCCTALIWPKWPPHSLSASWLLWNPISSAGAALSQPILNYFNRLLTLLIGVYNMVSYKQESNPAGEIAIFRHLVRIDGLADCCFCELSCLTLSDPIALSLASASSQWPSSTNHCVLS